MRGFCLARRGFVQVCGGVSLLAAAAVMAGEAVPQDAQPAQDVVVADSPAGGSLVICGGGRLPEEIPQRFIALAGGREARIVVVTTASRYADHPAIERTLEFWRNQPIASLAVLHTRSRTVADDPAFSHPLVDATGVWFVGGNQNKITESYLATRTELRLHELLERGGVIGGTSAGSAIMSRIMIRGGRTEPSMGHGLGFLPGTIIDQHFLKRRRQPRLEQALRAHPDHVGLGIDEGTAIVVQGDSLCVLGESEVCAYLPPGSPEVRPVLKTLKPGDEIELNELRSPTPDAGPTVAVGMTGE
jgi:cyanophycinase